RQPVALILWSIGQAELPRDEIVLVRQRVHQGSGRTPLAGIRIAACVSINVRAETPGQLRSQPRSVSQGDVMAVAEGRRPGRHGYLRPAVLVENAGHRSRDDVPLELALRVCNGRREP